MAFGPATDTYARGFAGARSGAPGDVIPAPSKVNAEASAEIPFGTLVKHGTLPTDALQLTATSDRLAGIVLHRYNYIDTLHVGTVGLKPGTGFDVIEYAQSGVYVAVDEAVTEASPVRARVTAAGGGRGTFRTSAVAGATVLLPNARFTGRAAAGEVVMVRGNFVISTAD